MQSKEIFCFLIPLVLVYPSFSYIQPTELLSNWISCFQPNLEIQRDIPFPDIIGIRISITLATKLTELLSNKISCFEPNLAIQRNIPFPNTIDTHISTILAYSIGRIAIQLTILFPILEPNEISYFLIPPIFVYLSFLYILPAELLSNKISCFQSNLTIQQDILFPDTTDTCISTILAHSANRIAIQQDILFLTQSCNPTKYPVS